MIEQGFRGNCDSLGKLGMCPSLAEPDLSGFPRNGFHNVSRETLFLEKTVWGIRQKGVPPLLLPTSVLQLPRCLVWIYSLDSHDSTLSEFDSFKKCNCSRNNLLQVQFASQMWATRPHLGSIFKKLLHRKTFWLPAARCLQFSFQIIQFPLRFQSTQSNVPLGRCHSKRLYPANIIIENPCFRVNRNI